MNILLNDTAIRVLGSLIEKEMATPEYYPLSLKALINACNQKSNRDPVVKYDEDTVLNAIETLKDKRLIWQTDLSRVSKYEESLIKEKNFTNQEAAIMCVLMLRGPQTLGEIRIRTERLHFFENIDEVNSTLKTLISLGYADKMPIKPGQKEIRYNHLMYAKPKEEPETITAPSTLKIIKRSNNDQKIDNLEKEIKSLSLELKELKQLFLDFKKQL